MYAHRLSYYLSGRDPSSKDVCHTCDMPLCVNPLHLFAGTEKENSQDMVMKGRHYCVTKPHLIKRGERHERHILVESEVYEIIDMIKARASCKSIAEHFGVDRSTVQKIKSGKNWKHITGGLDLISNTLRSGRNG